MTVEDGIPTPQDALSPKDIMTQQRLNDILSLQAHIRVIISPGIFGSFPYGTIYATHQAHRIAEVLFGGAIPAQVAAVKYDIYTQEASLTEEQVIDLDSTNILRNAVRPTLQRAYLFGNNILTGRVISPNITGSLVIAGRNALSETRRNNGATDIVIKDSAVIASEALKGIKGGIIEDSFIVVPCFQDVLKGSEVVLRNTYIVMVNDVINKKPRILYFKEGKAS